MIPIVDREQARKVDELAVEEFGIKIIQMMENAGRHTAKLAKKMLGSMEGKSILVFAGKGNNGGDGVVAARFLHNWGAYVKIIMADIHGRLKDLTKEQILTLKSMNVPVLYPGDVKFDELKADLIVDGLFGYNINGNPLDMYAKLVEFANDSGIPVLSIDVPTGLNPETGKPYTPCMKARKTICLANVKKGCLEGKEYAGEVYVADIGIPPVLYKELGMEVGNIFGDKEIIKV
ncbi:MAG: NAD(P)H-hydrate epimerase [Nanoarchaeota archaeon]|nr:NAD(P)H-hydrate epimerase [Nanoarchaeota archaeon]